MEIKKEAGWYVLPPLVRERDIVKQEVIPVAIDVIRITE